MFLKLEKLLCEWLAALSEVLKARGIHHTQQSGIDERVCEAVNLMLSCDLAEPFNAERLSAKIGLSQNHLIRLFRLNLQTTPGQYWDRLRVEHARRRLVQPETRVKVVALELGFSHLSHFSKWFKHHSGKTPREMVKDARPSRA